MDGMGMKSIEMRRVVVTGATGFIGLHLVKELSLKGCEIYAICRKDSAHYKRLANISGVKTVFCDLENINALPQIIGFADIDVFFHIGWENASGKKRAEYEPQAKNIIWSLNAVSVAKQLNCKKIVSVGTVCENQCEYFQFQDKFFGSGYYLLAKKVTHDMMRIACMEKELSFTWLTFYHPIGKYNKTDQLMASTILKLHKKESPKFGACTQLFDVIAVEDLARAIVFSGEHILSKDTYFIGSGKPRRLKEYLIELRDVVAPDTKLGFCEYADNNLPMREEWLLDSDFNAETGWYPEVDFKESVRRTLEYVKTVE